ncbi:hypothetical protein M2475_001294 [Breznakia sp. PF5-3]|uniref:hypothetical protein n=1 Tax=unclassified Breznakia TaxID=2623764 RepID=UPI002406721A|nr:MULTISPECIES: hypothetical protein [unclassified Breznakia]MDF9824868.1 hypothetical protein [Breznakia sp. PM6-1]MDF9835725.1 hypothetical protein [Breznakia sp. PF5-3]MDF9838897.1 hypothetical protein [Breznakia sp. PFB2-8]MDF9860923.1 hypothetical protein [Breznakia sp. PH5-24]
MKKRIMIMFSAFLVFTLVLTMNSATLSASNQNVYEFAGGKFTLERFDIVETDTEIIVTEIAKLEVEDGLEIGERFNFLSGYLPKNGLFTQRMPRITLIYNDIIVLDCDNTNTYVNKLYDYGYSNGAAINGNVESYGWCLNRDGKLKSGIYKKTYTYSKDYFSRNQFDNLVSCVSNGFDVVKTEGIKYTSPNAGSFTPDMTINHVNGDTYTGEQPYITSVNYDKDLFSNVLIDGEVVDSSNYEVTLGSTVVTFKDEYMKSLPYGEHNIAIQYSNGLAAEGAFNMNYIVPKPAPTPTPNKASGKDAPETNDTSNAKLMISLLLVAGLISINTIKRKIEQ